MQNVSGGVNAACMAAAAEGEAWKCFMAQYTLPHITTPHYIVNSFYDAWQWGAVLGMPAACGRPTGGCRGALPSACPAAARSSLEQIRANMIANQSRGSNARSSAFLYSCNTHCGQFSHDDRWGTLAVKGKSLRRSFTDWLQQQPGEPHEQEQGHAHGQEGGKPKSGGQQAAALQLQLAATVDCDGLGCNPTCCDPPQAQAPVAARASHSAGGGALSCSSSDFMALRQT